jgi:hypothetical protein
MKNDSSIDSKSFAGETPRPSQNLQWSGLSALGSFAA